MSREYARFDCEYENYIMFDVEMEIAHEVNSTQLDEHNSKDCKEIQDLINLINSKETQT